MPRLDSDMQDFAIAGRGNFEFTGARFDKLGATEYTLVTIAVDVTGSVGGFEQELKKMLVAAVDACKKSPRSDNILVRVILFASSSRLPDTISEVHGFKPLADIDSANYPDLVTGGETPLCDAVYSALGATNAYAEALRDQDYGVNAIFFVITDGEENASVATMDMVKQEQEKARKSEALESVISVLIGINDARCESALEQFQCDAGITQYVPVGNATPRRLAKLAAFVSESVSSQSRALGTGGPSQKIAATI